MSKRAFFREGDEGYNKQERLCEISFHAGKGLKARRKEPREVRCVVLILTLTCHAERRRCLE